LKNSIASLKAVFNRKPIKISCIELNIIGIISRIEWRFVLTFSFLERNSHIGIAEPVTRIVTQHPSRMQIVTFAIEVPLIVIMLPPLFRFPSVLHVATLASRRQVRSHVQSQVQLPPSLDRCQTINNKLVSRHRIVLRSIVSCTLSLDLVCRFVLCCLASSSGDHAPPSAPTMSIYPGFVRTSVRGGRVYGIRKVFTRSRKSLARSRM